jgi:hypothetical protein
MINPRYSSRAGVLCASPQASWRFPHSTSRRYKVPWSQSPAFPLRPSGTSVGGGGANQGLKPLALFLQPSGPEAQLLPPDAAVPSRRPADPRHPGRLPVQHRLDRKVEKSRPEACHRSSRSEVGRSAAPEPAALSASQARRAAGIEPGALAPGWRHPIPYRSPGGTQGAASAFRTHAAPAFPAFPGATLLEKAPDTRPSAASSTPPARPWSSIATRDTRTSIAKGKSRGVKAH